MRPLFLLTQARSRLYVRALCFRCCCSLLLHLGKQMNPAPRTISSLSQPRLISDPNSGFFMQDRFSTYIARDSTLSHMHACTLIFRGIRSESEICTRAGKTNFWPALAQRKSLIKAPRLLRFPVTWLMICVRWSWRRRKEEGRRRKRRTRRKEFRNSIRFGWTLARATTALKVGLSTSASAYSVHVAIHLHFVLPLPRALALLTPPFAHPPRITITTAQHTLLGKSSSTHRDRRRRRGLVLDARP